MLEAWGLMLSRVGSTVRPALIGTVGLNLLKIVDVSGVSPIDSAPSIAAGPSATQLAMSLLSSLDSAGKKKP